MNSHRPPPAEDRFLCGNCGQVITAESGVQGLPIGKVHGEDYHLGVCASCSAPVLHDQYEELINAVYAAEKNWDLDDMLGQVPLD